MLTTTKPEEALPSIDENEQPDDYIEEVKENNNVPDRPASILPQNRDLQMRKELVQSDESLSWLLSSVDYGKHKDKKLFMLQATAANDESKISEHSMQKEASLPQILKKLQKLFGFYCANDDDIELKSILKDEIDRLFKDSIYQAEKQAVQL